jgi:hypothetical protein
MAMSDKDCHAGIRQLRRIVAGGKERGQASDPDFCLVAMLGDKPSS